ncbi:MAG: hypothetical protein QOH01_1813 [Verrucomicrobiota bacterium]|jgi:hypothetical protein
MPHFPSQACRSLALLLCVAVAGCAPLNKYSYETFRANPAYDHYSGSARSDLLALVYADYVAKLLEGRSTGARITREISDSSLAVGGALLAAKETLEISSEAVAHMGVGIVIIQQLQKIFNAGGRSEAFADAAYLIRQAQNEYRQYNPNPSPTTMTENGAILIARVDAAVYAAQKTLTGRLPGLLDLKQATQPMTKKGADRESSGTPQTMFNAAGDPPGQMEALNARIDAAMAMKSNREQRISAPQAAELKARQDEILALLPTITAFNEFKDQIEENNGHDAAKNKASYAALLNDKAVKDSGVPAMNPDVDEINQFLRGKAAQKPTDAQKKAIVAAASRLAKNK